MTIPTQSVDQERRREIAAALRAFMPSSCVLADDEDVAPYECDGLSAYRQLPMVVVLPETDEHVRRILQTCHELGVPVVARGAGTGLSGGALPRADGVLLSLTKLMRILEIDPMARTARVQPGVRNAQITQAAAPYGLYYAPDPSSQIASTIAGNVAENAGGVHCLKYGLTLHHILKIRAYTIEGELIEAGTEGLDNPGYDIVALLTGSEGMLAIITDVTVKLMPKPECAQVVMAAFDDIAKAGNAVAAIIAAGIIPAGLELMDKGAIHAVKAFAKASYPLDAEAIVLAESDGAAEEVAEDISRIRDVMARSGARDLVVSANEAERLSLWAGRKAAFGAVGRISPDYYCMDGTIPRKRIAEILQGIADMAKKYGQRCVNVFHAGDGNLHPLILYDANNPGELERTEAFGAEILELTIKVGGTLTGEHGVGVEKIDTMYVQFTTAELETFHAIKRAFDPPGLLNPGKAVPTPSRSGEFRRKHVETALGDAAVSASGA